MEVTPVLFLVACYMFGGFARSLMDHRLEMRKLSTEVALKSLESKDKRAALLVQHQRNIGGGNRDGYLELGS